MSQIILRDDAKARGLKRYFTGKPCPRGHIDERSVSSHGSMECNRARDRLRVRDPLKKSDSDRRSYTRHRSERLAAMHQTYWTDPEKARAAKRRDIAKNGKKYLEVAYQKYWADPEKGRADVRRRRNANIEGSRKAANAWFRRQPPGSPYRLALALRNRFNVILRRNFNGTKSRAGSAVRDLGCTIEQFKTHIEAQFLPGMTWENWALDGWHLDHKIPLAKLNLADRTEFLQACHFTNYQPLWARDNLMKHDKFIPELAVTVNPMIEATL